MKIRVLGSAAGGGFPQWNCGCPNCDGVRRGTIRAAARTQESVAVSGDGETWFLLNASPEVRQQIESFAPLWPRAGRDSPLGGIVLTNGDLDHCLGLLSLRESHPLTVYTTAAVRDGFVEGNVLFRTLQRFPEQVTWRTLSDSDATTLAAPARAGDLGVETFFVPGKLALHLEGVKSPAPGDNIAIRITDPRTRRRFLYAPAVGSSAPALLAALDGADCVFFDGTFWSSDELIRLGLGKRRAEDMAHWPVGGSDGSLAVLARVPVARKVLIHVNNTNPLLREDSKERAAAVAAGVEVAYDGMELEL